MKNVAIGVVLVAVGVAAYFALSGARPQPRAAEALPAAHTAALAGAQQLDAVARRWMPVARSIDPTMTPEKVRTEVGFDPTTAEGWRGIGVDPEAGVGMAVDARLMVGADPVPMLLVRLVDREKALAWLSAISGEPARIEGEGPVRTLFVGDRGSPIGERAGWTIVPAIELADRPKLEPVFATILADGGETLDGSAPFADGFAGAEAPRVFWWVGASAAGTMAAGSGMPEELTSTVDFFAAMYPAAAFWLSEAASGTRLVATEKGSNLVRKLFVPQRRNPKVARYIGAEGWGAIRFSANLITLLDGVGEAMPPAAARARAVVGAARMALPMAAGVNWDDIAAGLSGHVVLAADTTSLERLFEGTGDGVALLGVADPVRADDLVQKVLARVSGQMPGVGVADADFGGHPGKTVTLRHLQLSVVRVDDVIVLGPPASVTAALKRADGAHLDGRLAEALDGPAMWAAVVDPTPLLATHRAQLSEGDRDLLAEPALKPFADDPRVALTVTLDRQGLLWRTDSAVPVDILTLTLGAAGRVGAAEAVEPAPPEGAPPQ